MIIIWDLNTGVRLNTFMIKPMLSILRLKDNEIISCGNNSDVIEVWYTETKKCIKQLKDHSFRVYCIEFLDNVH